jgi:hypothetical protein
VHSPFAVAACAAAAAVIVLGSAAVYARDSHPNLPPTSSSAIFGNLAPGIPCYQAVEYLDHTVGDRYRAWGYTCEQARYYASGKLISDAFSAGSRRRIFDRAGTVMPPVRVLWQRLAPLHVGWMVLPTSLVPAPSALQTGGLFRFVATAGPMRVFAVSPGRP